MSSGKARRSNHGDHHASTKASTAPAIHGNYQSHLGNQPEKNGQRGLFRCGAEPSRRGGYPEGLPASLDRQTAEIGDRQGDNPHHH